MSDSVLFGGLSTVVSRVDGSVINVIGWLRMEKTIQIHWKKKVCQTELNQIPG